METQIPCSTPEKRTVTFEELDLEIPHDKVEKRKRKKKLYGAQSKETRTSHFHFRIELGFRALSDTHSCHFCVSVPDDLHKPSCYSELFVSFSNDFPKFSKNAFLGKW